MPSHPVLTAAQLGRILQSARKAKGLSQQSVASRIGLSQGRLSALELNPGSISVDQLLALLANLGLELQIQPKGESPEPTGGPKVEW